MISNEAEFQKLMQEVDAEMIAESIPVAGRQLAACSKVAKKLGIIIPMGGFGFISRKPIEGVYSGYDLSLRIRNWFSDLYGKKLNVDFDIGVLAIEISGDVFKLRLPLAYGRLVVMIDPATMGKKVVPGRINVLDLIVDLTPALASKLSSRDFDEIGALFTLGMKVFGDIQNYHGDELLSKAHADFKASTFHLFHRPPELGLSKWASLQAVEKTLKAFIARRGGIYPKGGKGHDLEGLAAISEKHGLPSFDKMLLAKIQCKPGVRYENVGLTIHEAIDAQHAAVRICHFTLEHYTSEETG